MYFRPVSIMARFGGQRSPRQQHVARNKEKKTTKQRRKSEKSNFGAALNGEEGKTSSSFDFNWVSRCCCSGSEVKDKSTRMWRFPPAPSSQQPPCAVSIPYQSGGEWGVCVWGRGGSACTAACTAEPEARVTAPNFHTLLPGNAARHLNTPPASNIRTSGRVNLSERGRRLDCDLASFWLLLQEERIISQP